MEFKISKELIKELEGLIQNKDDQQLEVLLNDMHHADIAEILDELDFDEATYIFKVLDSEKTAEILLELEDDLRENILSRLSPKEIAKELGCKMLRLGTGIDNEKAQKFYEREGWELRALSYKIKL